MSYQSWSVVFGEQPSAAKWNILGSNDASFNDGTGIAGLYKNLLTVDSNPYKFSAYKSGAQTVNTGAAAKVTFETEEFDTNGNFASSTYTVPVTGFYLIILNIGTNAAASATRRVPDIYVNGAQRKRGTDFSVNAATGATYAAALLSVVAADTIEGYLTTVGANQAVTVDQATTYFQGFLVCRT